MAAAAACYASMASACPIVFLDTGYATMAYRCAPCGPDGYHLEGSYSAAQLSRGEARLCRLHEAAATPAGISPYERIRRDVAARYASNADVAALTEGAVRWLVDDAWEGRCVVTGHADVADLTLVVWNPTLAWSRANVVCMRKDMADKHRKRKPVVTEEQVHIIHKRLEAMRGGEVAVPAPTTPPVPPTEDTLAAAAVMVVGEPERGRKRSRVVLGDDELETDLAEWEVKEKEKEKEEKCTICEKTQPLAVFCAPRGGGNVSPWCEKCRTAGPTNTSDAMFMFRKVRKLALASEWPPVQLKPKEAQAVWDRANWTCQRTKHAIVITQYRPGAAFYPLHPSQPITMDNCMVVKVRPGYSAHP